MKICIINNTYEPYNRGGADRIAKILNQSLLDSGHETFVIATKPYNKKIKFFNGQTKVYFINSFFYNLSVWPKALRLFWHWLDMFDIRVCILIWRIFGQERPELVITNNLKGLSYLLPFLINKSGFKHIHILHDIQLLHPSGLMIYGKEYKINSRRAKIYQGFCRCLFASVDKVISPSTWLLHEHLKKNFFIKSQTLVLPNPLAMNIFFTSQVENQTRDFSFVYVGEIEKHKGIFLLLEAFKGLTAQISPRSAALIIIGTGTQDKEIRRLAENYNIKILGYLPNTEVTKILFEQNVLISPSLCYENSPTVIYEALSLGMPVIGSRLGGVGEIINNFSGLLFKPNDPADLTKKMLYAMDTYSVLKNSALLAQKKLQLDTAINYTARILAG